MKLFFAKTFFGRKLAAFGCIALSFQFYLSKNAE